MRQDLSLNLDIIVWARLDGQQTPRTQMSLQMQIAVPRFYVGIGELNSGLHATGSSLAHWDIPCGPMTVFPRNSVYISNSSLFLHWFLISDIITLDLDPACTVLWWNCMLVADGPVLYCNKVTSLWGSITFFPLLSSPSASSVLSWMLLL